MHWKRGVLKNNNSFANLTVGRCNKIMDLLKELVEQEWFESNSETRRLLDSGSVKINDKKCGFNEDIELVVGDTVKVGSLHFRVSKVI